jgi:hypothetical protein
MHFIAGARPLDLDHIAPASGKSNPASGPGNKVLK